MEVTPESQTKTRISGLNGLNPVLHRVQAVWFSFDSVVFPLAYKHTPFVGQYTILSNKWGAVHR